MIIITLSEGTCLIRAAVATVRESCTAPSATLAKLTQKGLGATKLLSVKPMTWPYRAAVSSKSLDS
jgi:hypothetical protein